MGLFLVFGFFGLNWMGYGMVGMMYGGFGLPMMVFGWMFGVLSIIALVLVITWLLKQIRR